MREHFTHQDELTEMQRKVTQEAATEPPFHNAYWNNHDEGIYVDVVDGRPLFSSRDKYDSGTGWPSFRKPIDDSMLSFARDYKIGVLRTEVRSSNAQSHLGHVFDDGPGPGEKRFCINSAAMRFIPKGDMIHEGYGHYLYLLDTQSQSVYRLETAIVSGGCFWGMQDILRKIPGVIKTVVGYSGGRLKDPHYGDVHRGETGHAEAVKILFDPSKVNYENILELFFRMHDPTTRDRQGNDIGSQYRSAIFTIGKTQKQIAQQVRDNVEASQKWKAPLVTEIVPAAAFYEAEEEHQDYLVKHPNGYTCHWVRPK